VGYLDDCVPFQRFDVHGGPFLYGNCGSLRAMYNWDQRHIISVATCWEKVDEDFFLEVLWVYIDDTPADVILIEVRQDGKLLLYSADHDGSSHR
jgi:hypothetical protein